MTINLFLVQRIREGCRGGPLGKGSREEASGTGTIRAAGVHQDPGLVAKSNAATQPRSQQEEEEGKKGQEGKEEVKQFQFLIIFC